MLMFMLENIHMTCKHFMSYTVYTRVFTCEYLRVYVSNHPSQSSSAQLKFLKIRIFVNLNSENVRWAHMFYVLLEIPTLKS